MVKKRGKIADTDLNLFAKTEQLPTAKSQVPPKSSAESRTQKRAMYDMTAELKEAVQQRANELGISASQLAMFLLCDSLGRYDRGEINPRLYLGPPTSPKYRHQLQFGDWYQVGDDEAREGGY